MSIQWKFSPLLLQKRYPLRISGAVFTGSTNYVVELHSGGIVGLAEVAPAPHLGWTAEACEADLAKALKILGDKLPTDINALHGQLQAANIIPPVRAGIDHAFWDFHAKAAGVSIQTYFALPSPIAVTSVTIGMETPEVLSERVPEILKRTGGRALKVKLGHADGITKDQEIFTAVRNAAASFNVPIRVDANGGWNLADAKKMSRWLADAGAEYVEQPMPKKLDDAMPELFATRPLPLFVDESVYDSYDIVRLAHCVDGINLKLMKCGGITEALRMVAVARAHKLQTMIGCMGESSLGIAAGASISGLFDFIDLDAQLNLLPDPAIGVEIRGGIIYSINAPGHGGGVKHVAA